MKQGGLIATLRALGPVAAEGRPAINRGTVETYAWWLLKFWRESGRVKPAQWTGRLLSQWMHDLAAADYSISSRKQALCAVVWAFKHILKLDPGVLELPVALRSHAPLRTIPTREELRRIFTELPWQDRLKAALIHGAGPRVMECCRLRVQDIVP